MKFKWARSFSIDTWNRISFSRKINGFKIYESTITQNMIYSLLQTRINDIKIYEALDEKSNGNDLEVFIELNPNCFKRYAVQSKIVYNSGRFDAIRHFCQNSNSYQIENLLSYARSNNAIPLYFFYLYEPQLSIGSNNGLDYKEYGVSVSSAHRIFQDYYDFLNTKWRSTPTAKDIILDKNTLTFPDFICNKNIIYHLDRLVFEPFAYASNHMKVKNYTCSFDEIINNPNWGKKDDIDSLISKSNFKNESIFNPKFRIVLKDH